MPTVLTLACKRLNGNKSKLLLEYIIVEIIPVASDKLGHGKHNITREGIDIALPCAYNQAQRAIKIRIAMVIEYLLQGGYSTYSARQTLVVYLKTIGLHELFDHNMLLASGFNVSHENFIGSQRLNVLHLIGENICLVLVIEVIVDHAPHRRVTRTRYERDNLDGMLTVKNIVDTITPAHLNRIDLKEVEVLRSL